MNHMDYVTAALLLMLFGVMFVTLARYGGMREAVMTFGIAAIGTGVVVTMVLSARKWEEADMAIVLTSLGALILLGIVVYVIWLYFKEDECIGRMSDEDLMVESYHEAMGGNYPNDYSREYERRHGAQ